MSIRSALACAALVLGALALPSCDGGSSQPLPEVDDSASTPIAHPSGTDFAIPAPISGVDPVQVHVVSAGTGKVIYKTARVTMKVREVAETMTEPYRDKSAVEVVAGLGNVNPGMDLLLMQMRQGDVWTAVVPSKLAYGANGGKNLPPNSVMNVTVEILKVE